MKIIQTYLQQAQSLSPNKTNQVYYIKDIHEENSKTLKKEMEDDTRKWKGNL